MDAVKKSVVVIGGGASGLSCALLLASGIKMHFPDSGRSVLVIDNDRTDVKRGLFNNALGIDMGIDGRDLIEKSRKQVLEYPAADLQRATVISAEKIDKGFRVTTHKKEVFEAEKLVLATGFRGFKIKGLEVETQHFPRTTNPDRVMIESDSSQKLGDNLYVCGQLAGESSQWMIASGSGAKVAIEILSEWAGDWKVVHDKNGM
ncbi:MAG: NAD(P)/FAD-dependent oxidoreductase [Candidatus Kapaibacteriales bacterium]